MQAPEWVALASAAADEARHVLSHRQGGALLVTLPGSTEEIAAAFGHETGVEGRSRRTLALLRSALDEAGLCELGFGVSQDGRCWALLVRHEGPGDVKTVAAFLEEAVYQAWQIAGWAG